MLYITFNIIFQSMKIKSNSILVTGAEGFIGSHLCEKLVRLGSKVKALVLYNSFNQEGWLEDIPNRVKNSIEIIPGDVRDQELIKKISSNVDLIFHLAALISIPYSYNAPRSYINTNVLGTLNILEAAKLGKCKKIISTSTSEVYGTALKVPIDEEHKLQAQSPYAASKIAADFLLESYVKSFNLPAAILRPFNTYGPRQSERAVISSVIRQILDNNVKEIKVGNLDTKRDFNYVQDTVDAFISLAEASNKKIIFGNAYNTGTGKAVSIKQTIKKIIKITGTDKKVVQEKKRFRPIKSEVHNLVSSSSKLNKLTNWSPKFSLEEGLKETIDWWEERKKMKKIRRSSKYAI